MTAILERLLRWLDKRAGCFPLSEPIVIRHGSAWLRIAPDESPRWYPCESMAMEAGHG